MKMGLSNKGGTKTRKQVRKKKRATPRRRALRAGSLRAQAAWRKLGTVRPPRTNLPEDVLGEIMTYNPDTLPIARRWRTMNPNIKDYLDANRMKYTADNIKYFNKRRGRKDPEIDPAGEITRIASSIYPMSTWWVPIAEEYNSPNALTHQCCGVTNKGKRCNKQTHGLFCKQHEGSTTCYWNTPYYKKTNPYQHPRSVTGNIVFDCPEIS